MSDAYGANVSLLLHCDGSNGSTSAADSSYNAVTLTANAAAQLGTAQAKFGTASMYFDGTSGTCFTTATSALFGFGTGDFTIEGWCYPTDTTTIRMLIDFRASNIAVPLVVSRSAGGALRCYDGTTIYSVGTLAVNTWTHWAWTRSGTTNRLFVDGALVQTFANGADYGSTKPLTIGADVDSTAERWLGYLDEMRITKGVARYTAAFTAPTTSFDNPTPIQTGFNGGHHPGASLELSSFTKLMLHFDGTNGATTAPDTSQSALTTTFNGTAALSTTSPKFGTASLLLPGTVGNNVTIADTASLRLGSDDFCIDGWFYYTGPTAPGFSDYDTLFQYGTGATQSITCVLTDSGLGYKLSVYLDGLQLDTTATRTSMLNTWTHVAVTRIGYTFRLFVNGVEHNEFNYSNSFTDATLRLGTWEGESGALGPFVGNIDEFRILKGCAMYTTTPFTVPAAAYADPTKPQTGFNGGHFGQATVSPISIGFNGGHFSGAAYIGPFVFSQDVTASHGEFDNPNGVGLNYFKQRGKRFGKFGRGMRAYARTFITKGSKRSKFALATRVNYKRPRTFRTRGFRAGHFGVHTL